MINGWFVLLWFVASAGFAKLLAMGENSIHGFGWQRDFLQRVRTLHNLLLISYPPITLIGAGLAGPRALLQPGLPTLGPGWLTVFAIGVLGFLALIASTLRYQLYRPPVVLKRAHSRVVDIAARANEPLVGEGRAHWVATLPGNQQFSLEVSEQTYELPRLPAAWDGVSIVHISDLHFRGTITRRYFEEVMEEAASLNGDLLAFTGDLLDRKDCLNWVPSTLGRLSAPLGCYFVLGNHDWYLLPIVDQIRASLKDHGWQDISGQAALLQRHGVPLAVCGNERPWMGRVPDLSTVPPDTFRILLSHGPDQIGWARRHGIDLMLAGHTHGGQIRLPILGPVYSPSIHSCRYAGGIFHEDPTLMIVSRGISGREPIRYNCRPELAKITLRASGTSTPTAQSDGKLSA